ncbi:unnamed protein product, partial [Ectocarpus fasciculatus]
VVFVDAGRTKAKGGRGGARQRRRDTGERERGEFEGEHSREGCQKDFNGRRKYLKRALSMKGKCSSCSIDTTSIQYHKTPSLAHTHLANRFPTIVGLLSFAATEVFF